LNVPRIKGTHTAMKSGMLAAEAAVDAIISQRAHDELVAYPKAYRASWIEKELRIVRNVAPLMKRFGDFWGAGFALATMWLETMGIRL
ncbi:hypothetical protein ABTQ07_20965, partial [Acinetobacter baumannii]